MRSKFDKQLAQLNTEMTQMGALCEEVIALAAKALISGSADLAGEVAAIDSKIDQMERDIEALCLKLLLQQQPVARDLRQISAALKMITDLERIGDQGADIAEIIPFLDGRTGDECESVSLMAKETIRMVTDSVDAYVKKDVALAKSVIAHDDTVDECFVRVKSALIRLITEKHEDAEYALDLLMIAKYFERIGDHATNVAEWVVFSVTGIHKDWKEDTDGENSEQ